jgi:hypothetical protein
MVLSEKMYSWILNSWITNLQKCNNANYALQYNLTADDMKFYWILNSWIDLFMKIALILSVLRIRIILQSTHGHSMESSTYP